MKFIHPAFLEHFHHFSFDIFKCDALRYYGSMACKLVFWPSYCVLTIICHLHLWLLQPLDACWNLSNLQGVYCFLLHSMGPRGLSSKEWGERGSEIVFPFLTPLKYSGKFGMDPMGLFWKPFNIDFFFTIYYILFHNCPWFYNFIWIFYWQLWLWNEHFNQRIIFY